MTKKWNARRAPGVRYLEAYGNLYCGTDDNALANRAQIWCRACGTIRRVGEAWLELCPNCRKWHKIGEHFAAVAELFTVTGRSR